MLYYQQGKGRVFHLKNCQLKEGLMVGDFYQDFFFRYNQAVLAAKPNIIESS
jgi:hypothetical protein